MTTYINDLAGYCDAVTLCLVSGEACGVGCRVRRMRSLASEENEKRER